MGFELVGKVWDVPSFSEFLQSQDLSWASGVTIHHTAYPSLAMRPDGLRIQHIKNIRDYYRDEKGWSSGPHLFIDDDQIFGMSSLSRRGVHARSFNATHIGIEVLGNYDSEDPLAGRGADCWTTAAAAVGSILSATGWGVSAINGHRDDPLTSKTCPGRLVDLGAFRDRVELLSHDDRDDDCDQPHIDIDEVAERIKSIEWQLAQLKSLLT